MKYIKYLLMMGLLVLASCFYNRDITHTKNILVLQGQIDDLINFSQDPLFYANLLEINDSNSFSTIDHSKNKLQQMVSKEKQDDLYAELKYNFFRVWTDNQLSLDEEVGKPIIPIEGTLYNTFTYYQNQIHRLFTQPGIGENKLVRDLEFAREIKDTADLDKGFNTMKRGIMLNPASIRVMPTLKPYFLDFDIAGEGYPFDYWQNSTIPVGTPIFIYHENQSWALIESHICSGWVPRSFIAYIEDDLIEKVMLADQIVITKEKQPLFNIDNSYLTSADIGTVFSVFNESEDFFEVLFFKKNSMSIAVPDHLLIPKTISHKMPIPLTADNIATLCNEMMGQTYGWGGMYFNRDCSQSLLDLFIGFGILLPRNGRAQAYEYGLFYDMSHLNDIAERKNEIIAKAIPFLTLIRTPGHIMLYLGYVNDEPIVLHNIWGIRTFTQAKKGEAIEGRHIIGRMVITTLEPGKELYNVNPNSTLIHRLEGITFIIP